MNGAYQSLQGLITSFTRSAAAAEKVFALMDSCGDIGGPNNDGTAASSGSRSEPGPKPIDWLLHGEFELRGVDFYYQMRPDNLVLNGFSLTIPAKSVCALVGRSGGGKSTIISMLMYEEQQPFIQTLYFHNQSWFQLHFP